MNKVRLHSMLLAAVFVAACSSSAKKTELSEIDRLERDGKLEQTFEQLASQKPGLIPLSIFGQNRQVQMAKLGERLAAKESSRLEIDLDKQRTPEKVVPLTGIESFRRQGDKLKRWDETSHSRWMARIDSERANTSKAIDGEKQKLEKLPLLDTHAWPGVLETISRFGGPGSTEESFQKETLAQRKKQLYDEGVASLLERRLENAEQSLSALLSLDPGYLDTRKQSRLVQLAGIQKEFREPKNDTTVEAAFQKLIALPRESDWKDLATEASPLLGDVAGYYQTLGTAALGEERLADAFVALSRARTVRKLANDTTTIPEELALVEKVREAMEAAVRANHHGLALGYLMVTAELQPDFPQLKRILREARERAYEEGVKRVGSGQFSTNEKTAHLRGTVSSKVSQALFRMLPHDIRLIERDQLQAVLREQEILALQNKANLNIASTNYLIQGSIGDAVVETSEQKGRQVMRVKTGEKSRPNPDYDTWRELKADDRKKVPQPSEFLFDPVMEDVTINVATHRKTGLVDIAFSLVDSATAKVLFNDTVKLRKMVEGKSSDALHLGSYVHPMEVATLPADGEFLEILVEEASKKIATVLFDQLKDQDVQYEKISERYLEEDNAAMAANAAAFALVIGEAKGRDMSVIADRLRRSALLARVGS